jgi:hypothetical protein
MYKMLVIKMFKTQDIFNNFPTKYELIYKKMLKSEFIDINKIYLSFYF